LNSKETEIILKVRIRLETTAITGEVYHQLSWLNFMHLTVSVAET